MNAKMTKIFSQVDNRIFLRVYQGHFATSHSHVTHYFDMTNDQIQTLRSMQLRKF